MTVTAAAELRGFEPSPLLRNAHLQSVASRLPVRRRYIGTTARTLLASAERRILDAGDGVRLAGYLSRAAGPHRGLVVMLHGWEGCADSAYMLSAGALLHARGFDVFRLNLRDHGDTHDLNEELFHSCRIDEVVNAVATLQDVCAPRRLALVGFSLGGNFALRVALRAPQRAISLDRVFAVAPVLRPHSTMQALEEGFWLYRSYFLKQWRRSLYRKAALFPERYRFGDLRRLKTLTATTDFFVRRYTEFATLDDYLHGYALTGDRLDRLQVPTRAVFAADDPVIPARDIADLAASPALQLQVAAYGGHCGFVPRLKGTSWIDSVIAEDLERVL